jgi:hypothetical protein
MSTAWTSRYALRTKGIISSAIRQLLKITLTILLLLSAFAWAGTIPKPADYTVNVHVTRAHYSHSLQKLDVIINGEKFELEGSESMLLALGDYKAKLVRDDHKSTYGSSQAYEFLFPDQKTRKFWVIGQSE